MILEHIRKHGSGDAHDADGGEARRDQHQINAISTCLPPREAPRIRERRGRKWKGSLGHLFLLGSEQLAGWRLSLFSPG